MKAEEAETCSVSLTMNLFVVYEYVYIVSLIIS